MPSLNTENAILSNAIKVNSSYNVGIGGAASGSFKLQVTGTSNLTGALSGTSATFSGNMGVGTASPFGKFNVVDGTNKSFVIQDAGVADTIELVNYSTSGGIRNMAISASTLTFATGTAGGGSATTRLTIASTGTATFSSSVSALGNVLIGTSTAPSAIGVNDLLVIGKSGSASNAINFSNGSTTNWGYILAESGKMVFGSGSSSNITFETNAGSERMRITSSGNVGIGTSSPTGAAGVALVLNSGANQGRICVKTSATGDASGAGLQIGMSGADAFIEQRENAALSFATNAAERMRITSGGNVLIGTTSNASNYKFVVSSNAYVPQYLAMGVNDDGRYIGQGNIISGAFQSYDLTIVNYATSGRVTITNGSNGVVLNNGATSWSTFSDERLKNINGGIENAVDKLLSIRAVKYSWKTDKTNKENLGLIAQDIEKVFPQVVDESKSFNEGDDTEYLSVKYTELIPVLVKAIQELNERIKQLENK